MRTCTTAAQRPVRARPRTATGERAAGRDWRAFRHALSLSLAAAQGASFREPLEGFANRNLPLVERVEDVAARWLGVYVDEFEPGADAVEAIFYRRVTHAEHPLHFLDRAVTAHERGDKHLVLVGQARHRRQLKLTLNGNIRVRKPHALHGKGALAGEPCQRLPVLCHVVSSGQPCV